MNPDYNKAAAKAAETLISYGIKASPISPLQILKEMDNVIIKPFSEMYDFSAIDPCDLNSLIRISDGVLLSVHKMDGRTWYVVAYNNLLPFTVIQHAMARELGHIVLKHDCISTENSAEAICFAQHLLCPRPLIHALQATGMRLTTDVLANLTGIFHQCLTCIRRTPGTKVPAGINRFVRSQFMPFIMNFFEYHTAVQSADGSALADFGTFMDGYVE